MPKSKGHKFWNKFTAWASHEGQIRVEMLEALEEFVVSPGRVPADAREPVQLLFEGWFLMERALTRARMTPIELFIRTHARPLKPTELAVYRRFAAENHFGFFKVEDSCPGESMELRLMPGGEVFHVVEVEGSKGAGKGSYLITRILPFEDHWAMPSLVGAYPSGETYPLDRSFGETGGQLKPGELRPRHVLPLFMPKVDWMREGVPRVKARLAMLLQRWGVSDIKASAVEKDIAAAHARRDLSHPLLKEILQRAPSAGEAAEAVEVLTAWWNLTIPKEEQQFPRGPKEMMLLKDLERVVGQEITEKVLEDLEQATKRVRAKTQAWLHAPQVELGGKTPLQVIGEERKALGNPREELDISFIPNRLDLGEQVGEGARLANRGTDYLIKKDAARALESFEKAYASMKDDPAVFRVLGKMATAYVMLGKREPALEMLRAALKANPDYEVARNNLQLLESMTSEEFTRKHRSGFFEKANVVSEEERSR